MINLSNLFGGDADTAKSPDAKAEPEENAFLQDLFGESGDSGFAGRSTDSGIPDDSKILADDEIGSIIASMTDLSSDLDSSVA